MPAASPILCADGISKSFPGVQALEGARLTLEAGEVHGLVGENGAGKSTLVAVLCGALRPDAGTMRFMGAPYAPRSPHDAHARGIRVVFQHLSLVPQLSVRDNLLLGREPLRFGLLASARLDERLRRVLSALDPALPLGARVNDLSAARRYLVEIAKAVLEPPKVLVLDEPTASLAQEETDRLYRIARELSAQGAAVLWITHRLAELRAVAERVTVMRDGRFVTTVDAAEAQPERLLPHMIGREVKDIYPPPAPLPEDAPTVLEVENLSTRSGLRNVSFALREGEVLGVGGLVGAGGSRLGRTLFGLEPLSGGAMTLFGERLVRPSPARSTGRGVVYVPADRLGEGVVAPMSAGHNMTLSALRRFERLGLVQRAAEDAHVREQARALDLRPPDPRRRLGLFSGGNQQKALLARGMTRRARLYLLNEPTQGIDVGAKAEIYRILQELARGGAAVVLISSDMQELLNLSHRILVFAEGCVAAVLPREQASEARLLARYFDREAA